MPLLYGLIVLIVFLVLLFLIPLVVQVIWNNVMIHVLKQSVNPMSYGQAFAFWFLIALLVTGLQIPFSLCTVIRG